MCFICGSPIHHVFFFFCIFFLGLPTNVCSRWRRQVLDQNHLSCYPMFALYIKDVKIQVFFDNWKLSTHSLGDFYGRQIQLHVLHLINTCRSILQGATLRQDVGCDWLQPPGGGRSLLCTCWMVFMWPVECSVKCWIMSRCNLWYKEGRAVGVCR